MIDASLLTSTLLSSPLDAALTTNDASWLESFTGLEGFNGWLLALVIVGGFAAGWVDAVVGGGGLIQLTMLLTLPGVSPVQALATNKFGSIAGTATSSITYFRRVKPDLRTALPMAAIALFGAYGGAILASSIPAAAFKPIIAIAILGIGIFTAFKPSVGQLDKLKYEGRKHHVIAGLIGFAIGVYDGLLGPGTGSFLVIALVSLLGYSFLQASAKAKIVNLGTNLGALLFFAPQGYVLWGLGAVLAVSNVAGGYLGARTAIRGGSKLIRWVFLIVVSVLFIKLAIDIWNEYVAS